MHRIDEELHSSSKKSDEQNHRLLKEVFILVACNGFEVIRDEDIFGLVELDGYHAKVRNATSFNENTDKDVVDFGENKHGHEVLGYILGSE